MVATRSVVKHRAAERVPGAVIGPVAAPGSLLKRSSRPASDQTLRQMRNHFARTWELYLFVLPALIHIVVFRYLPIYGLRIAFTDGFSIRAGRSDPAWNNFAHFIRFFNSAYFFPVVRNTIAIALYSLSVWPLPLILAIMINEVRSRPYQKAIQMVTYAPHFISTVVVVSMMIVMLSPRFGVVNTVLGFFGVKPIFFMGEAAWGPTLYVLAGIWQNAGYSAIIYLAALSDVDVSAKEAAFCGGATRLQIIRHVNLPWIAPTITILFIMRLGHLLSVGFEQLLLMQNDLNVGTLEVISTYIYKAGILESHYDYAAAVQLLETVINFALLVSANRLSKRLGKVSLW